MTIPKDSAVDATECPACGAHVVVGGNLMECAARCGWFIERGMSVRNEPVSDIEAVVAEIRERLAVEYEKDIMPHNRMLADVRTLLRMIDTRKDDSERVKSRIVQLVREKAKVKFQLIVLKCDHCFRETQMSPYNARLGAEKFSDELATEIESLDVTSEGKD